MTKKERLLIILRFFRLYWIRFVIAITTAIATVIILCNLGNIIKWFSLSMGKTVITENSNVQNTVEQVKKDEIVEKEQEIIEWQKRLPKIYAVEDKGIYAEFGFFQLGSFIAGYRINEINRKNGYLVLEDEFNFYRIGFNGNFDRVYKHTTANTNSANSSNKAESHGK